MKLKLTSDGHAVLRDGKPVYVSDAGEVTFDAGESIATMTRLKREAEASRKSSSDAKSEIEALKRSLVSEKVGNRMAKSPIAEKLTIPVDIAQAFFGSAFQLEGDDLVAYDKTGNKIFSRSNPGRPALFDEAIEQIIDSHPYRDRIIRAAPDPSNAAQSQGNQAGAKRVSRAAFERFTEAGKMTFVKSGGTVFD